MMVFDASRNAESGMLDNQWGGISGMFLYALGRLFLLAPIPQNKIVKELLNADIKFTM